MILPIFLVIAVSMLPPHRGTNPLSGTKSICRRPLTNNRYIIVIITAVHAHVAYGSPLIVYSAVLQNALLITING